MSDERPRWSDERPRWTFDAGDPAQGMLGALVLAPVELYHLGPAVGAAAVFVLLFAATGLAVGTAVMVSRALAARARWGRWATALAMASGSLLVTVPGSRHLFDGAFASTLPGARYAPVTLPLAGWLGLAAVLWIGDRLAATRRWRLGLAASLAVLVALADLVNRTAKRSELPDAHTMLLIAEIVMAGLAVRLLVTGLGVPWSRVGRDRARGWLASAALVVVVLPFGMIHGLSDAESRWAVATRGMHARLVVRVVRAIFDADGDGYSPLLGGGDCDDHDPAVSPGAIEIEGNDVDENCDGRSTPAARTVALREQRDAHLAQLEAFRRSEQAAALVTRTSKMNVLILAIDTLRADVMTDTEENRRDFPHLLGLLTDARWFTRAFAPSAGTDLSMSGALTGRIDPFAPATTTLAEAAKAQGRVTHAVIPSEVLRYVGKAVLTRGLDGHRRLVNDLHERDVGSYSTSARTTELGLEAIDRWQAASDGAPFYLLLHYFDVHEHHEIDARDRALRQHLDPARRKDPVARYRAAVALVDAQIGVLRQELERRGLWESTVVVLLSDHGEGLGEDPRLPENHGLYVYNPLVHVPLAVRIPGVPPRRIDAAVSLLDIHPTLLILMGGQPDAGDGVSLVPHLVEDVADDVFTVPRPLPLNESEQYGVIVWPFKLMVRRSENLVELYDLSRDFGELHNLAAERPDQVSALQAAYAALSGVVVDRTRRGRRAREKTAAGDAP